MISIIVITSISIVDTPSTSTDFVDEYWKQHPDEDPCNTPEARAWGLC